MPRITPLISAFAVALALSSTSVYALQRVFVSSTGLDSNPCTPTATCRSFAAAMGVVDAGGEIVALDSAGYGAVTVTKSVSIIANPGFYAGIAAGSGTAVTIATGGVNVVLRGLNINGIGASLGVSMSQGTSLVIENCVISNFSGHGIEVTTAGQVRVINTIVSGNGSAGIYLSPTSGNLNVDISDSKFFANNNPGIWLLPSGTGIVNGSIDNTVASGNVWGIDVGGSTTTAMVAITRSTMSNNYWSGLQTEGGLATVSNSMATGNGTWGFRNLSGTIETLGNNTVRSNPTNTTGTITLVSGT